MQAVKKATLELLRSFPSSGHGHDIEQMPGWKSKNKFSKTTHKSVSTAARYCDSADGFAIVMHQRHKGAYTIVEVKSCWG